jgi:hypothetical protein
MAPQVGLEPTTVRLTAECSTTELLRNNHIMPGDVLLSQGRESQLPSALKSLTSVFGMGTGVASSPSPPDLFVSDIYYSNIISDFSQEFF